jgi:arsenic resistance protein ArsH
MKEINATDPVARALRAWVLPDCIPEVRRSQSKPKTGNFTEKYRKKFDLIMQ